MTSCPAPPATRDIDRIPDALATRVKSSMLLLGYGQLSQIDCRAEGNCITLTGKVPSYHMKQVAQTIAMKVEGVDRVVNAIQVMDYA